MAFQSRFIPALSAITLFFLIGATPAAQSEDLYAPSTTAGPALLPVVTPVAECSALASADLSSAVGSATHITSAIAVKNGEPAPYCDVKGYVAPEIQFEVRLPLAKWTQRFVQIGCGGLCGMLNINVEHDDNCMPAQNGELALASTDMGHSGNSDGSWGAKDYQLRIDFAYRGVHVTALAAKALIAAFYGQAPKYSYFAGCSDGGREALMEAQRFPKDFNGITAGAPAMNFVTQNTFYHGWNTRVNTRADGKPILTADKLPILHKAALAKCDADDGVKDGLINRPWECHFDPSVTECKPGENPAECLTPAQVKVAREIYAGAHDSEGNKLVLSGLMPGSELSWAGVVIPNVGQDSAMGKAASTGVLKYIAYENNPPDSYTLADLKFDRATFAETTKLHALYDATDPDLSAFASAGGKLIVWHGLADPHISPINSIAYYTAMQQQMGKQAVDKFARLYLFPGGYHCGQGEGPFEVDLLSAIMAWVEGAHAPDALIASHKAGADPRGPGTGAPSGGTGTSASPANAEAKMPDRTRPIFPYPFTARFTGNGSSDDASNFVEGSPEPVPALLLNWLGSSFYTPHYELWCVGSSASMECKQTP